MAMPPWQHSYLIIQNLNPKEGFVKNFKKIANKRIQNHLVYPLVL